MFTRNDAAEAVLAYFGNEPEPLSELCFKYMEKEPGGIIVYFFEVCFSDEVELVSVYRDNEGVIIMIE